MPLISLTEITADQRAQPRMSILVDKVGDYTEDMERGDKFPALVVFFDGKTHWLGDGFHRYYAATAARFTKIECHIREGGLRDAILFSCGANGTHGIRRTNNDKRRAAARLLEDEEWSKWSDNEIARHCCVTQPFIGKMRKEVASFSPITVIGEDRTYRTKHGKRATMKPALRDRLKVTDGALVAKWLHEIERLLGKMPEPDVAIDSFPADQHYLFPLSRLDEMANWMVEFAAAWRANMKGGTK